MKYYRYYTYTTILPCVFIIYMYIHACTVHIYIYHNYTTKLVIKITLYAIPQTILSFFCKQYMCIGRFVVHVLPINVLYTSIHLYIVLKYIHVYM